MLPGEIEGLETAPPLCARDSAGAVPIDRKGSADRDKPFAAVLNASLEFVDAHPDHDGFAAVGHRGTDRVAPELVTPARLDALGAFVPLDPIHTRATIAEPTIQ
jgi:hypothetical protein